VYSFRRDRLLSQLSSPPRVRSALHGHSGWVTDLVYLGAQHHRIASCSLDKRVKLWTPDDGRCIVVCRWRQKHASANMLPQTPGQ
jgi:hypothetical protein